VWQRESSLERYQLVIPVSHVVGDEGGEDVLAGGDESKSTA